MKNIFRFPIADSVVICYLSPRSFEASVAQLVELHLAKVVVEGSNPFARSIFFMGV